MPLKNVTGRRIMFNNANTVTIRVTKKKVCWKKQKYEKDK